MIVRQRLGPFSACDRRSVAEDILRGMAMRVRGYVILAHVSTGELATAANQNTLLDDLAAIKTNISDDGATFSGNVTKQLQQQFRGLHIRTHPDNGTLAGDSVSLLALDEVIVDDGTRYTGLTLPLTADITASGAGGLDTGARTGNKWYEVYLIGKSATRAVSDLRLIFHRAKEYPLDQSFTTAPDAARGLRLATSTLTDKLAQGVTFVNARPVEFIDIKLKKNGTIPTNNNSVWLTIEADVAGSPSGTPLATSDKLSANAIATTSQLIRFVFRSPMTASAAQYHVVLQGDYSRSDTNYIEWAGLVAGGYAGGSAKQYNGSVWSAATGVGDFFFQQYSTLSNGTVTYPSGYDQKCKLAYVYQDNATSTLFGFIARDNLIVPLTSLPTGAIATNYGSLVDLSLLVPPCTLDLEMGLANDTASTYVRVAPVPDGFGISSSVSGGRIYGGAFFVNSKADNAEPQGWVHILTEFQALYLHVNTGNGVGYVGGYRWMD